MGTIRAHGFTSLDGVIDTPTWSFDFGFDPAMGHDIGNLMSSCHAPFSWTQKGASATNDCAVGGRTSAVFSESW